MSLDGADSARPFPILDLVDTVERDMRDWQPTDAAAREQVFARRRSAAGIALFSDEDLSSLQLAQTPDGFNRQQVLKMRDAYGGRVQTTEDAAPEKPIFLARYLQLTAMLGDYFESTANPAGILACQAALQFKDLFDFAEIPPVLQMRVIYALEKAGQVAITYEHDFDKAQKLITEATTYIQQLDPELFDTASMLSFAQANLAVTQTELEHLDAAAVTISRIQPTTTYRLLFKQMVSLDLLRKSAVQSNDPTLLEVAENKIRQALAGFSGVGELAPFLNAAKKENPIYCPRDQARLQKELLLLLAAEGKKEEYETTKTRFAVEWATTLNVENKFDQTVFAAELLAAEARFFHVDDREGSLQKQREAAALYDSVDLDFHRAEVLVSTLDDHHEIIPPQQAKQDFHEAWQVLEKRFNRRLVAEWRTAAEAPPLFQKLMRVLEILYGQKSENPLDTWQRATNEHGKYLERKLHGDVVGKLESTAAIVDLPTFADKTTTAFGAKMLQAVLPKHGGRLFFSAVDDAATAWSLELKGEEIAELRHTGRLRKDFFFTDRDETQPVAHAFLLLHGQNIYLFHRGKRLLPFTEPDENILLTNLVAGLLESSMTEHDPRQLRRPRSISHLHLSEGSPRFREAAEIGGTCYLRDLGFLSVTAGGHLPVAMDARTGQIIGGAAIEKMQEHELSYPEIFMCCDGTDGRATLQAELDKRGAKISDLVESGSFFMIAEHRGDEYAATHALQAIAEQAKKLGAKYIFLAYHRLPEAIFKRAGITPQPIKEVHFDEHVAAKLRERGLPNEVIERVRQGYFERKVIQPIRVGLIDVEQTLSATTTYLSKFTRS